MTIFRTAPELRPYSAEPWLCTLNSPSASTGKSVAGALATPPWLNEGCWRNESLLSTPSIKKILDFSRCPLDRKSTRLNSSHGSISYAVFCLKKKTTLKEEARPSSAPERL